ncbi:STAS domain-containing protein [Streptomyces galbus]|uniref:STAS domain-containing protein n=2 Tax=Streptomyces galbus TaxID=33898 RepID=A0ABX1IFT4_STRGB|nr:STAS domain-containing protein [Streptomyces galbus]
MDSVGINILIAAYKAVSKVEGWIRLAAPSASVLRALQIVGIDDFIACRPTLREALAA